MAKSDETITIKKYANRRLYNTATSTYVTLEDLAVMVKAEEDFAVIDAKNGEDITRSVLTQIIFEQEGKGQNLLPVDFLRGLIRFYGDSMQSVVPSYLDQTMKAFQEQQESLREQFSSTFSPNTTLEAMNEQARKNAEIFQNAMSVFNPFNLGQTPSNAASDSAEEPTKQSSDLDDMRQQLAAMQAQLKAMDGKKD